MTDGGDDPGDGRPDGDPDDADGTPGASDGTDAPDEAGAAGPAGDPESGSGEDSERASPFSDLADRTRERRGNGRNGDDDPFAALDDGEGTDAPPSDLFEEVETDDLGDDDVWAALTADDEPIRPGVGVDDAERVEREDPTADRADHVVPKASYCQQCEHFASPPTVACTHDGTDIVAVVDADHFRVRGCPVVAGESDGSSEE